MKSLQCLLRSSVVLLLVVAACSNKPHAGAELTTSAALAASAQSAASVGTVRSASPVARIAFLDKEHACECTRKRVDDARAALDAAMRAVRTVPVDHVYVDTQADKAKAYLSLRPAQALPALYFLDDKGNVIDMLQGEIGQDQVSVFLRTGTAASARSSAD